VIDHFIYAVPDLQGAGRSIEEMTGTRFEAGGVNRTNGTRNLLAPLTNGSYLELLAVDTERGTGLEREPPFGLADLSQARLVAWVARVELLRAVAERACSGGVPLGPVVAMSRTRPDGARVTWEMTYPVSDEAPALVPLLIDWGKAPPGGIGTAAAGATLAVESFTLRTPVPDELERWLSLLNLRSDVSVSRSEVRELRLSLRGPGGHVELW
jgi:hypothetical protein